MLPFILKRAMILVAVCAAAAGMIAFCAGMHKTSGDADKKLRIGYVAEYNKLTQFAVSYVENMESVKSLCSLEPVTEKEGMELVENGELAALIVLPEDVINEILSGSNAPAKLYLPQDSSLTGSGISAVGSMLFEELALAGIGMLDTAQAQIYAVSGVFRELSVAYDGDVLQAMYDEINTFNLGVATGRERLFEIESMSVTGNDTYAVYYGSAIFTIYVMFAGLFFGAFCKRSNLQQTMTAKRIRVGFAEQLADRCLAGSMLMLFTEALPLAVFLFPAVRDRLSVRITPAGIICLLLTTIFITIYDMLIYQIVEKQESALVIIGLLAVLQAYLSGCLIPSALLPQVAAAAGEVLPASYIKAGFTILFTGDGRELFQVVTGLLSWGIVLFAVTLTVMRLGDRSGEPADDTKIQAKTHVPSICAVMFKRLLHKKSMWLCMVLVAVLSVVIVKAETNSQTQIQAAVYDETGEYAALLEAHEGLVRFEILDSSEQVRQAVLKGDVECGYVLPADLTDKMIARRANRLITVYRDADTVTVPIVNEVLFERIFHQVSGEWYKDYLLENSIIQEAGVDSERLREIVNNIVDLQMKSGSTFQFEIEHVGTMHGDTQHDEQKSSYPTAAVIVIAVLLCGIQGILQVLSDIRNRRFYKRNRVAMSMLTIILPVLLGLFIGFLTKVAVFLLTL